MVMAQAVQADSGLRIQITLSPALSLGSVTGRLYLLISRTNEPEVRLQSQWVNSPQLFGLEVRDLKPGASVSVNREVSGTPLASLSQVPADDYYVQAVLSRYTLFHRADGIAVWAHNDQGEGQNFAQAPGNFYSAAQRIHIDPFQSEPIELTLDRVIPTLPAPPDSQWIKHVRIQSALLSAFWGQPMYLGAIVLLPSGYAQHPEQRYPIIYQHTGHYSLVPPFEFASSRVAESPEVRAERSSAGYERGDVFARAWTGPTFPRVIAVTLQHTTPFADMSGATDSVNNGPYDAAIHQELIPYIETHFRVLRESYARLVVGKASGGRDALTVQVRHPELYGGVWAFFPWAFDFSRYFGLNLYQNANAFTLSAEETPFWARNPSNWIPLERNLARATDGSPLASFRQIARLDAVLGRAPGGELSCDEAIFSPVGPDGYPQPLIDRSSGRIDPAVAAYWRSQGDLADYLRRHWSEIGPHLIDKVHLYAGDTDHFRRNEGVRALEAFFKATQNPHVDGVFRYGLFKGDYQPMTNAQLVVLMAEHIRRASHERALPHAVTRGKSR